MLVAKTANASNVFGIYQVGIGGREVSIEKGLENKGFEKEILKNVYNINEKNYVCKRDSYGYVVVIKEGKKTLKKRLKTCIKNGFKTSRSDCNELWFKKLNRNTGSSYLFCR